MIDLDLKYLDFIKDTMQSQLHDCKLYIFGSRVKGTSKQYSDIDIAIDSSELTPQKKSQLMYMFENSTLPYEVDIIDLRNVSKKFFENIKDDLVLI
ncbi:MAG: nucleotidyltransferase domain-containing protein [Cyanobacteriota bacterium]|nr:nucleotidyltransferase domain-containing protein [Cyanobacteriota bacterium]MDY6359399.1 nucleotidyltransferase domain-containing protein [Cyanobacteriota bacterium]MDY6364105.1 nucleotidyltransferase domain-containing protein [Cyanobacteriota bacterium]MDY6383691.1 nucleotidyltransferase domain-containing protein [Cyanobacteriota bacterium]